MEPNGPFYRGRKLWEGGNFGREERWKGLGRRRKDVKGGGKMDRWKGRRKTRKRRNHWMERKEEDGWKGRRRIDGKGGGKMDAILWIEREEDG
jgi:hypothetical protein